MKPNGYDLLNRITIKLMILLFTLAAINMFWIKNTTFHDFSSKAFLTLGIIWILTPLIRSLIILMPDAIKLLKIKTWRIIVTTRKYYKLTKINNFLLHVGATLFFSSMLFYAVFNIESPFFSYITTAVLCLSFLLDIFHRMKFIYTKIWKGAFGKICLAFYATLAFIITNFSARYWVMHTTGLDAKYFSEAANSLSILLTPLSYIIITSGLCLIIIIPECIWLLALSILSPFKGSIKENKLKRMHRLLTRMRTGKRPEILKPNELALLKSKVVFFRILPAPLFFAAITLILLQVNTFSGETLDKLGREWLVANYYQSKNENSQDVFKYYEISESRSSMAYMLDGKWYFTTKKNEK